MSDPLRIGFVVEGPTDFVVLESVISRLLEGREFESNGTKCVAVALKQKDSRRIF